jgi:hypothetical protein
MKNYESEATIVRNKGNEIFQSCKPELQYTIMRERIFKCINLYEDSIKISFELEEKFKASKNIALSYLKLVNKVISLYEPKYFDDLFFLYFQCVKSFVSTLKLSKNDIKKELTDKLKSVINLYTNCVNTSKDLKNEEIVRKNLFKIKDIISWNHPDAMVLLYIGICKKYLADGINEYDQNKYIKASSSLNNCLEFTREAVHYKKDISEVYLEALYEIEEDACFYIFRCDSYRNISESDKLFQKAVFENEELQFHLVLLSLDKLREVLMNIEEGNGNKYDVELAAITFSKMGVIFENVIKNRVKSELYCKKAVELGLTLHPKNVEVEKWYKDAKQILELIRKERDQEERKNMKEAREKYEEELKETIDEIEEKSKQSIEKFLIFILDKHCPNERNKNFDVYQEIEKSNQKKVILKVISFYHPDKFSEQDLKKKVLMEEITKILNRKYEYFKS